MRRARHVCARAPRASQASAPSDLIPALCLAAVSLAFVVLAVAPRYRFDWFLESLPTFIIVPALLITYRRRRFSDRAYIQGAILLILHTIGSHYTYSEVPLGEWLRGALGGARNHYDRIVHFSFGLLGYRAMLELDERIAASLRGRAAAHFVTMSQVAFWAVLYEIVEWLVAVVVDPTAGQAFLGTQGDPWDAQKDMAIALVGGALAALVELGLSRRRSGAGQAPATGPALASGSLRSAPGLAKLPAHGLGPPADAAPPLRPALRSEAPL